jgi:hypothetical protein
MKQQVLIIKVKYDEKNQHRPSAWEWSTLLHCEHDCVEILNSGSKPGWFTKIFAKIFSKIFSRIQHHFSTYMKKVNYCLVLTLDVPL